MLSRRELAGGLDISEPMVSRLVARGMPETSVADAENWRRSNLSPAKVKRGRRVELRPAEDLMRAAEQMMQLAGQALDNGNTAGFDALAPAVRAALAAVPRPARDRVRLHFDVVNRLVADWVQFFRECEAEDGEPKQAGPMSDAEAEALGHFWYALAAGEPAAWP